MGEEIAKNKGGRPRRSKDDGLLSRSLTFRVRPPLYEKVQHAAAAEKRSLSEEIEARLVHSFERENLDQLRFGDPSVGFLANLVASTVSLVHRKTGKSFTDDPETYEAVKEAVAEIFDCSMSLFKDVANVPDMQRRFDHIEFEKLVGGVINDAADASIDLKRIVGR